MTEHADRHRPQTVGVLTPTGRDAVLASRVLERWDIDSAPHDNVDSLIAAIRTGVGAAVVAEEALTPPARRALVEELGNQPGWSDVPIIVLTVARDSAAGLTDSIAAIAERGNVTLLERPKRIATFVTTLRAAMRARSRQYDVRDQLIELAKARSAAEEANRAKIDFLATMSHELRTPLNAIGGYTELLELGIRGAINDTQREDLARIQRSQRHLLSLINGLLTFARVERGNIDYRFAAVSTNELMSTVEALVAPQARARGLTLDFSGCAADIRMTADIEKLEQILLNLLGNAIKFTEAGGRVAMACEARGDTVAIIVTDTGVGIPRDKLSYIFEPFVQIDSGLTRARDGVGLGLAISRDLAKGMHGDLTAESEPGKGSRFTLTLPVAR